MGTTLQRRVQQNQKDAIFVLGMHRSGTSMLAGILQALGCKGPKTPIEGNERNPKGYFESQRILELNDEILATAGTRWNDWQPLRDGWHASPRFNEFRARAAEVIRAEYGDASMIYLKDPRMCRILPLWRDVFEDLDYRVACILTHRHPIDVADSLKARKNIEVEPSVGMLSWLCHVLDAEIASRELPRIFTSYSSLLPGWQSFADRAEQAFGFTWPTLTSTARERVAELVDPNLRHHGASIDAFLRDPVVPEQFRETLQVLERWAQDGENREDHVVLDRLRRDFAQSTPLLYAPITALETTRREVRTLVPHKAAAEAHQAELDALKIRLTEAEAQRDKAIARETELITELSQSRTVAEDAQTAAEARQAELDALKIRLTEAEAQRDKVISKIQQMREELEQTRRSAETLQADADTLSAKLAKAELQEAKLSMEVEHWVDRLIERDKKIFTLQRKADQKRHASTATKAEKELSRAVAQEEALRKELDQARRTGEARQAELLNKIEILVTQLRDKKIMHVRAISDLHNTYKSSTSWRVSAPVRVAGKLIRRCG